MLLKYKTLCSIDPCHNMDETQKHYINLRKPGTKGHISNYTNCPDKVNP